MAVYDAAVRKVPEGERRRVYEIYLARASEFFGVGKVREVYEAAIEAEPPLAMSDADTRALCVRYAAMERQLGEVDRARAIYGHAAALADPRADRAFWADWNEFEVKHGNEDTFREMLRVKRSVAAAFSQQHFNTAVIDAGVVSTGPPGAGGKRKQDDMAALEAELEEAPAPAPAPAPGGLIPGTKVPGFVSAGVIQQGQRDEPAAAPAAAANPEDIELGDEDDEDEGGAEDNVQLETKQVPEGVFGSLAKKQRTDGATDGGGA